MTICKGCGQEIRWIKTKAGKSMPVDVPGTHFVSACGPETFIAQDGRTVKGRRAKPNEVMNNIAMPFGYVPHWATCPAAGHFKKGGGQK